ncbi:MAG: regulatory protein RecX [Ruminococcus sp.]|jgi:regulatory protein
MIVTEIASVTKKKHRVFLDGQPAFILYSSELARYGIRQGEPIPEESLHQITESVLPLRAKKYAMNLLIKRDRTEKELRDKLRDAGYCKKTAETAVAYVKSYGYIDDRRYAVHFLEGGRGKESIRNLSRKLLQKGVSRDTLEEILETYQWEEDTSAVVRRLIEKRMKTGKLEDEKALRNMAAYLGRRGFSGEEIWPILKEYTADL